MQQPLVHKLPDVNLPLETLQLGIQPLAVMCQQRINKRYSITGWRRAPPTICEDSSVAGGWTRHRAVQEGVHLMRTHPDFVVNKDAPRPWRHIFGFRDNSGDMTDKSHPRWLDDPAIPISRSALLDISDVVLHRLWQEGIFRHLEKGPCCEVKVGIGVVL